MEHTERGRDESDYERNRRRGRYADYDRGRGGLRGDYGREGQYASEEGPEWSRWEYGAQGQGYRGDYGGATRTRYGQERFTGQRDYDAYDREDDYRRDQGGSWLTGYEDAGGQGNYGRESSGSWRTGYGDYGRRTGSGGSWRTGYGDYGRQADYSRGSWLTGYGHGREQGRYEEEGTQWGWGEGPHRGRGPSGYQRSDERIREDVNERLTEHGWLDATHIQVEVRQGIVTLQGSVSDRRTKRMAEDAVEDISGVKDVQNQLQVKMEQSGHVWQHNPQSEGQQTEGFKKQNPA